MIHEFCKFDSLKNIQKNYRFKYERYYILKLKELCLPIIAKYREYKGIEIIFESNKEKKLVVIEKKEQLNIVLKKLVTL